ncbi:MAG: preprotein translocase subunit SecE [Desulfobacterales bacterium]|jgi:preprotein translocase subunit SecE|nr:preprotein translocase subunit SecE [Desulfobacterales bacterium]
MARLQRKKSPITKKKKKDAEGVASSQAGNDAAVKKTALFSGSGKDIQKPLSLSRTKALSKTKGEPGKIKRTIDTWVQFLREVKIELKKVVWPSRKQTIGSTVVVLILVMIISLFLGVVDFGLSSIIRVVLQ